MIDFKFFTSGSFLGAAAFGFSRNRLAHNAKSPAINGRAFPK
jgi:hypothetical protein